METHGDPRPLSSGSPTFASKPCRKAATMNYIVDPEHPALSASMHGAASPGRSLAGSGMDREVRVRKGR